MKTLILCFGLSVILNGAYGSGVPNNKIETDTKNHSELVRPRSASPKSSTSRYNLRLATEADKKDGSRSRGMLRSRSLMAHERNMSGLRDILNIVRAEREAPTAAEVKATTETTLVIGAAGNPEEFK